RRTVREDSGSRTCRGGEGDAGAEWRWLPPEPSGQRRVRRRESPAEGQRRGLLAQGRDDSEWQAVSGWHDVHHGEGDDPADSAEGGGGQRRQLRRGAGETGRRRDAFEAGPDRTLGSVRRI